MQKIGLFYNTDREKSATLANDISEWLRDRGKEVCALLHINPDDDLETLDLVISIGGDGSLLKVASIIKQHTVPVLGVNAGSVGFLTSVKAEEVFQELEAVIEGKFIAEERLMLTTFLKGDKAGEQECHEVLNDVVISREGMTRFLKISVHVDGSLLTQFGGDGVIISTPTGSSAYSLSAGGPLLYPTLQDILITPLCPHSLKSRPVVVPSNQEVTITLECEKEADKACIVFDGQLKKEIASHSDIMVKKSSCVFHLFTCSRRSYYNVIDEKLN